MMGGSGGGRAASAGAASSSSSKSSFWTGRWSNINPSHLTPESYKRDDWGWLYYTPILFLQLIFFFAIFRSRTIRFQQLLLCLCGFYWCVIVYYVQYFSPTSGKVLFCDVTWTSCSYCLHQRISYLPEFFGLLDQRQSSLNRSIADTNLLYFLAHVLYPILQKLPLIGYYMTHLGFFVSLAIAVGCGYLTLMTYREVHDVCVINLILCVINFGLCRSMWLHFYRLIIDRNKNKVVSMVNKTE